MAFCYLEQHRVAVLEDKCKALELEKESILASNIQVCIVLHFGIKRNPVEIIFKSHVRLFFKHHILIIMCAGSGHFALCSQ